MANTYDVKCWDLADSFLDDAPPLRPEDAKRCRDSLAKRIQQTIDEYMEEIADLYKPDLCDYCDMPSPCGKAQCRAAHHAGM